MIAKKGSSDIMTPEGLGIIVAVLCLIVLVAFAGKIFFSADPKINQATSTLDQISQIIRNLQENQSKNYLMESPSSWNLVYFSVNDKKPASCDFETCFCICDNSWLNSYDASVCEAKKGICKNLNENIIFEKQNFLNLNNLPRTIIINKTKEQIIIKYLLEDNVDNSKLYGEPKL